MNPPPSTPVDSPAPSPPPNEVDDSHPPDQPQAQAQVQPSVRHATATHDTKTRHQGWSLFPPALKPGGNMHSHHKPPPFQHMPNGRKEYGAAIDDLPLYSPPYSTPKKLSSSKSYADLRGTALQNRELEPVGTHPFPSVPIRSSSLPRSESPSPIKIPQRFEELEHMEFRGRAGSRQGQGHHRNVAFLPHVPPQSPFTVDSSPKSRPGSRGESERSYRTDITSLQPLQPKWLDDQIEPLNEENLDPGSFDLVAPAEKGLRQYSLETRSEQLFSTEHLREIFDDPDLLLQFTGYLNTYKPSSVPILIYYLDSVKALKAISYANAVAEALDPLKGFDFTATRPKETGNTDLEEKARLAFDALVREELPAYITHAYIQTVSLSIQRRITGTLPSHLRDASEGLAEVFCLTDPSRPDNPIVFSSEEFHRTTQYGMDYVIGRNCRFLQGPKTNPFSVRRIREKIEAGQEHCEVFLNYRRDGSPFMNLLMCAPLCDSRGTIRYFIGAQVDVSGLVKDCANMESFRRLVHKSETSESGQDELPPVKSKDELKELSQMFNLEEMDTVRRFGGSMQKENQEEMKPDNFRGGNWSKPRVLLSSGSPEGNANYGGPSHPTGQLSGIYENYLLVRPYPSLRILFASPTLRVPGMLQSPFMSRIGGSNRTREGLTQALAEGRGVTAKVKWVTKHDSEGRNRWIHCSPLIGSNGAIGVWMVVIVDDEASVAPHRRFKIAPPVDPKFGRSTTANNKWDDSGSLRGFALAHGGREGSIRSHDEMEGSGSAYSLRID